MSQLCQRLLATMLLLGSMCAFTAVSASAAPAQPDTWRPLGAIPATLANPLEALAVDPANSQALVAGTESGQIYRSTDGGLHWVRGAQHLGKAVTTLVFDPSRSDALYAGSTDGVWVSHDGGASWQAIAGTANDSIRSIAVGQGVLAAATQQGVLTSHDGDTWAPAGLRGIDVSALVIVNGGEAPQIVAGGDGERAGQALPLYLTQNGGQTWTSVGGSVTGSTMVSTLLLAPPEAGTSTPRILLGTNGGLFLSTDGGQQWAADNAGGGLPPADVTSLALGNAGGTQYYIASDGGASSSGGLWVTRNDSSTFVSLQPPEASVTAVAAVAGATPTLYVASFRPIDHTVALWGYEDAGGSAQAPIGGVPTAHPAAGGQVTGPLQIDWVKSLSSGPEAPFLVVSAVAVLLLLLALGSWVRSARRL